MSINLEWYKIFCNVAGEKNITKAAENMYVSQSAITQTINKLEQQIGCKLFIRTQKGVTLTTEGRQLYSYLNKNIEAVENAEDFFHRYLNCEHGHIKIGAGHSLTKLILLEAIKNFSNKYPNVTYEIVNDTTSNLIHNLAVGKLDIILLYLPFNHTYSEIKVEHLNDVEDCFWATKEYLKNRKIRSIKDLQSEKLILPSSKTNRRKILNEYCQKQNLEIKPFIEVASFSMAKELGLKNLGIVFDEKSHINNEKDIQVLDIQLPKRSLGYATLNNELVSTITHKFIEYLHI